jgi:hypothetical protein
LQKAPIIYLKHYFESLDQKLINFINFYISSSLGLNREEVSIQLIKNIHVTEISYFDPGQKIKNLDNDLFQNVHRSGQNKNLDILISLENSEFLFEILELKSNLQFEINQMFSENITITFKGENIE